MGSCPDAGLGRSGLGCPGQSRPVPVQCHTRFGPQPDGPNPQSNPLSRCYGSNLTTSLTYIVLSTRSCSPWRPAAGYGYGPARKSHHLRRFARADRSAPDTARAAVLLREQRPLSPDEPIPGTRTLTKKRRVFRRRLQR
ncbi:uncharacterized protein CEXT_278251 [Caerostris extrusa]|uniref:Uncharacterized protein n=1 Tax=Caerostris extrusa TaxID=172846 RepID=A0AAV4TIN3_CAEEX|nr:uncharacterized protein CEXT_278251 [Caerostris extrusa]